MTSKQGRTTGPSAGTSREELIYSERIRAADGVEVWPDARGMNPTLNGADREVKVLEPVWNEWLHDVAGRRMGPYRVVRGFLPDAQDLTELKRATSEWGGELHHTPLGEGLRVVMVRRMTPVEPTRWWVHIALFAAAFFSATVAGAFLTGMDPLTTTFVEVGGTWFPVPTQVVWGALGVGLPFSIGFIGILLAHELGHYFAALYHRVLVSPPTFIPFPPYFSLVGTLGAFIRLKGPIVRKPVLFDIGVMGPVASFVLSLPVLAIGLARSQAVPTAGAETYPFLIRFLGEPVRVGTSLLVQGIAYGVLPDLEPGMTVVLDPLALAGWLGLFVTALNLLPLGQLDGGHVLYAVGGRLQLWFARLFIAVMIPLGLLWWGWWLWGAIAVAVSRGRLAHPPVLLEEAPMGRGRIALGWLAVLVFFLTFSPAPLKL